MSQNPQTNQQPPSEKIGRRLKRKKIRQAFKMGNFDPQIMLSTFKNYYNWREKRQINLPLQQLKSDDREPLFSIALHCGTKNGKNQIFNDYANTTENRQKADAKNKTKNNFQKILNRSSNFTTVDDEKRLTFVDFKTKRNQKDNFFSYPDVKNIQFTDNFATRRLRTEPKSHKSSMQSPNTGFRQTGFPRQLANLKEMIQNLPSVKQREQSPKYLPPEQMNSKFFNNSFINNSFIGNQYQLNQTLIQANQQQSQLSVLERRKIFRKSKTQSIRGYIEQLKDVISFADQLMQEETQQQLPNHQTNIFNNTTFNKTLSPQHGIHHRKYWPQYPKYSLPTTKRQKTEQMAKFFTNFSYSDPKLNNQLQNIVNAIKIDLNHQQKQMNKEIAQSQKNSIQLRYKYKMSIEKDNYKRNVKSFLKCKKEYRIQRRREQVRANGITRVKKSNPMEKAMKVVHKQEQND